MLSMLGKIFSRTHFELLYPQHMKYGERGRGRGVHCFQLIRDSVIMTSFTLNVMRTN